MMKFKKCLIFICLIVCMFSIASVCASDINDTVVANDDQSDEVISIENSDNDEISVTEESELSADAGTFSNLADAIAADGDELILTKNYTYSTGDLSYKDGITIDKEITIDGNGFTINGNNQARAFSISSPNVILKNINFVNCKSNNEGGAIYWSGSNGVVSNCSFVNNSATNYGGAIHLTGVNGAVSGCTFTMNSVSNYFGGAMGGAINWNGANGNVSGCNFTNNSADYGGAIYWFDVNGAVSGCNFTMNSGTNSGGGAIYWYGKNGAVSGCNFTMNSANKGGGGAIRTLYCANLAVSDCSFVNNSANVDGGAIYWAVEGKGVVSGCSFVNNSANVDGGAICIVDDYVGVVSGCSFVNNSASRYGGAINWNGTDGAVSGCTFTNNSAIKYGGAIYWRGVNGDVSGCTFTNNSATEYGGGAIYWWGVNGDVSGCTFTNNSANVKWNGGAIYWFGVNGTVSGCTFTNNSADNGGAIYWYGGNGGNGAVSGCTFTMNSATDSGGAIYWYGGNGGNGAVNYCIFIGNYGKYTVYSKESNGNYNYNYNWWGSNNPVFNNLINKEPTYWVIANLICNGYEYIVRLNQINTTNGKISDFDNETKLPAHNVTYTFSDGKVIIAPAGVKIYYEDLLGSAQIDNQILYDTRAESVMTVFVPEKPVSGSTIIVILFNDAKGNITLSIAGENNMFDLVNGIANVSVPDIDSGKYSYVISYSGDYKYIPLVKKGNLTVEPRPIDDKDIVIPSLDGAVGKNVTVQLPDDAKGTVILSIEGKDYRFDVVDGIANVKVPELADGGYTYVFAYSGDSKYSSFTRSGNLTFGTKPIDDKDIVIPSLDGAVGKNVTVQLPGDATGTIILSIEGKDYRFDVVNGIANVTVPELADGEYTYGFVYSGDSKYSSFTRLGNLTFGTKPIDDKDIVIPSLDGAVGKDVTVQLPGDATGTIILSIGAKDYKFDVVNGTANVKVPDLANGGYNYIITYSGDSKYSSFIKTGSLTVNKVTPAPTPAKTVTKLTLKKVKVKKSAKKLAITATLKINGKAVKGKVIKFKFNKKSYKAKTNKKGVAKITVKKAVLKKLKVGKKVKYQATYGKITKKVTVKVKK